MLTPDFPKDRAWDSGPELKKSQCPGAKSLWDPPRQAYVPIATPLPVLKHIQSEFSTQNDKKHLPWGGRGQAPMAGFLLLIFIMVSFYYPKHRNEPVAKFT